VDQTTVLDVGFTGVDLPPPPHFERVYP
jgi:hypothetical protein